MKWLKDLFKPQELKGVAPSKPLEVKPLPKPSLKESIQAKPSNQASKSFSEMNKEERIALYKSLKDIPKPTIEFPLDQTQIEIKPVPPEYLKLLNPVQRKLISASQDFGFMIWKSQNPNKTSIANGEIIAVSATEAGLKKDYDQAIETGDYQAFPFTDFLQGELRAKVLNTITAEDTEEKLLKEFFELLPKFANSNDIAIIQSLIETAQIELPKRSFIFPASIDGKDTVADETRTDSLDLLALKELVSAMKGQTLSPLNLASGFFTKLTEFSDKVKPLMETCQDFAGIILKVEDDLLKEIRVAQAPRVGKVGVHGEGVKNGLSRYSPLLASVGMYLTYFLKIQVTKLTGEAAEKNVNEESVDIVDAYFELGKAKFYFPNVRYYMVVDGCVAGPNDFRYYGHQYLTANNTRIFAGEVFMFHTVEGKPRGTKIAFSPRDYNQVHPLLRTGGLIYGDQDMSYQSVPWFPGDIAETVVNDYKDWWAKKVDKGNNHGDAFSPALIMAQTLYFLKDENGKPTSQTDIFKPANYPALGLVLASISEETEFTKKWWLDNTFFIHTFYSMDVRREFNENFYSLITNLNRHWNLKIYLKDGLGVSLDKQSTLVQNLCKKMGEAQNVEQLKYYITDFYPNFVKNKDKKAS